MNERRIFPRLPLDAEINYQEKAFATLEDISESGMSIISETEQQSGKIINLSVHFPDSDNAVNIHCKIVWSRSASEHMFKSGLEFWNLPAEAEVKIREQMELNKIQAIGR